MKISQPVVLLMILVCVLGIIASGSSKGSGERIFDFSQGVDPYFTTVELNGGSTSVTQEGLSIISSQEGAAFIKTSDPLPEEYEIEALIQDTQIFQIAIMDDAWGGEAGAWGSLHGPHMKLLIHVDNFGPVNQRSNIAYVEVDETQWDMWRWDGNRWHPPSETNVWVSPEMATGELYRVLVEKDKTEYTIRIRDIDGETLTKASIPIDQVRNGEDPDYWVFGDMHTDSLYSVSTRIVSAKIEGSGSKEDFIIEKTEESGFNFKVILRGDALNSAKSSPLDSWNYAQETAEWIISTYYPNLEKAESVEDVVDTLNNLLENMGIPRPPSLEIPGAASLAIMTLKYPLALKIHLMMMTYAPRCSEELIIEVHGPPFPAEWTAEGY